MPKLFAAKKEDFACEKCGTEVKGSGYTNHCPNCLWSKHVDVNPGDRKSECGGMMKPIGLAGKTGHYQIIHRCLTCGHVKNNQVSKNDNVDLVIELSKLPVKDAVLG